MPIIELNFKESIGWLERKLYNLSTKNIQFATTRALTWTANALRDDLKTSSLGDMILRTSYAPNSIRAKPAKTSDRQPIAHVGSHSPFMAQMALTSGGEKNPLKSNALLGVPSGQGSPRQNIQDKVPRSMWPGRLLAKYSAYRQMRGSNLARGIRLAANAGLRFTKSGKAKFTGKAPYDYFVGPLNRGLQKKGSNGRLAVYKIVERGSKVTFQGGRPHRVKSDKLELVYSLKKSVPIPYKWHFHKRVLDKLPDVWRRNIRKSIIAELADKGIRVN